MNDVIISKAKKLVKRCGNTDPFRIASEIGVKVHFSELGMMKGMYAYIKRNRYVVVNNTIDENMQKIVCAHELGHDQLHREMAKNKWTQEFMVFNMNERPEYEANIFATEILLPDEQIIELARDGLDIEQIARAMYSDVNLVACHLLRTLYFWLCQEKSFCNF
ncbi:MAG: ImmA/IrrE family metallo-endopeptidase [Deferribacteraceae bacterium]|nr:ImmA/IrrE family metallo-endopeptidase [Deferribacteraceae bacterium]